MSTPHQAFSPASTRQACLLLVLCWTLVGCDRGDGGDGPWMPGPSTGGETHWMSTCVSSRDCGGTLQCVCGICTLGCDSADACASFTTLPGGGLPASAAPLSCVAGRDEDVLRLCDAELAPVGSICIAGCLLQADCAPFGDSFVCIDGLCLDTAGRNPELVVDPVEIVFPPTRPGDIEVRSVEVRNTGTTTVRIESVSVFGANVFSPTIRLDLLPVNLDPDKAVRVEIAYAPRDARASAGLIVVESDDPDRKATIPVRAPGACGTVVADAIALGTLYPDAPTSRAVALRNDGATTLTIDALQLQNGSFFQIDTSQTALQLAPDQTTWLAIDAVWAPGTFTDSLTIAYRTTCGDEATTVVPVSAVGYAPCLQTANADGIAFPDTHVGATASHVLSITNCAPGFSGVDAHLYEARIDDPLDRLLGPAFELRTPALPLTLSPATGETLTLYFRPTRAGARSATLQLVSNDHEVPSRLVPIAAAGREATCPLPTILCRDEATGAPVTADQPTRSGRSVLCEAAVASGDLPIATTTWTLTSSPGGTPPRLDPDEGGRVRLTPIALGQHLLQLRVVDEAGNPSCLPATGRVDVAPIDPVTIELLWTAADATQPVDLDLHVLHTAGRWGDARYDIWAGNPSAQRVSTMQVRRADAGPGGPEHMGAALTGAQQHRIGIHRATLGDARARAVVRVWVRGLLVWQSADLLLDEWTSFLEVANVQWPEGAVQPVLRGHPSWPPAAQ